MSSGYSIDIDKAKAEMWVEEVSAQLRSTLELLKEVNAACAELAGEDDSIMIGLEDCGRKIHDSAEFVSGLFTDACDMVKSAVEGVGTVVQGILDKIGDFVQSIH